MDDHDPARGWPFLVARGRRVGYRSILVPELLAGTGDDDVLNATVRGDAGRARTRIERLPTTAVGPLTAVSATHRVTRADIAGGDAPGLVTDQHSRPLELLYGFVCRGAVDDVDEADLHTARQVALEVFGQFLDDEDDFAIERSKAFLLRTRVRPGLGPLPSSRPQVPPPSSPRSAPPRSARPSPTSSGPWPPEPVEPSRRANKWNAVMAMLAVVLLVVVGMRLLAPSSSPQPPPQTSSSSVSSSTEPAETSDVELSGDRECTLGGEPEPNRCVITLTLEAPEVVDLASVGTDVEPSPDDLAGRDAWAVDRTSCQEPADAGRCRLVVTVSPSADDVTEDLDAVLRVTFGDQPDAVQEIPLRARPGS